MIITLCIQRFVLSMLLILLFLKYSSTYLCDFEPETAQIYLY
jgi:hypothetical protein